MGDGLLLTIGVSWDGNAGAKVSDLHVGQAPNVPGAAAASGSVAAPTSPWQLSNDGMSDPAVLAGAAASGVLIGIVSRAFRPGAKTLTVADVALDAGVGLAFGTCLVGSPAAESVCESALSALPRAIINRAADPRWDFRIDVLSHAAFSLGKDALGGTPVLFAGYRMHDDGAHLVPIELFANASVDVASDALVFSLSNVAAGAIQGHQLDALWSDAARGAAYGATLGVLTNVALGAPFKLSSKLEADTLAGLRAGGAPSVSDVLPATTFRTSGIFGAASSKGLTLGSDVLLPTSKIRPTTIGHELMHREQIAGVGGADHRLGVGTLSFLGQWLGELPGGYRNISWEREAYHFGQHEETAPDASEPAFGRFVAMPFALSVIAAPTLLMPPKHED
jgi:hypothetical protein